jgi:branched-chain amino acid transport system permease protein
VIQGAAFVLCVLFLRKGVVGTLEDWLSARAGRRMRQADGTAAGAGALETSSPGASAAQRTSH